MKTIKGTVIEIGTCVVFDKYYERKCSQRFTTVDDKGYCKEATAIKLGYYIHGYVVGIRSVIMSEAKFHGAYALHTDEGSEIVSSYVEGKRETVLLVTKNIREEPFILRLCDCQ